MASEKKLTGFIILERSVGDESPVPAVRWNERARVDARDREHALRVFVEQSGQNISLLGSDKSTGTFSAVSDSAWQPRTVKVTSTPKVEISAA